MQALTQALKQQGVQEVRFLFCQTAPQSAGMRQFLQNSFTPLKASYPKLPLLVREAQAQQPMIIARFPKGIERGVAVEGKSAEEIQTTMLNLVSNKI